MVGQGALPLPFSVLSYAKLFPPQLSPFISALILARTDLFICSIVTIDLLGNFPITPRVVLFFIIRLTFVFENFAPPSQLADKSSGSSCRYLNPSRAKMYNWYA
jgi:hypothetical protein